MKVVVHLHEEHSQNKWEFNTVRKVEHVNEGTWLRLYMVDGSVTTINGGIVEHYVKFPGNMKRKQKLKSVENAKPKTVLNFPPDNKKKT